MLVIDALHLAIIELQEADIAFPRFDASQLLAHVLGRDAAMLQQEMKEPLLRRYSSLIERRATGYPLQYLLGEWEFYGHRLKVGKGVLIPRADTEALIDRLERLRLSPGYLLDLCSGSGCLAIAAGYLFPDAQIDAVELSPAAFSYLTQNLALHDTLRHVTPHNCDALTFTPSAPVDVILCNPPYIKTAVLPKLQREVTFEPMLALDGKADGLYFYRKIAARYLPFLKPDGWLLFEIGYDQADEVADILTANGYRSVKIYKDLSGNDRVAAAQK